MPPLGAGCGVGVGLDGPKDMTPAGYVSVLRSILNSFGLVQLWMASDAAVSGGVVTGCPSAIGASALTTLGSGTNNITKASVDGRDWFLRSSSVATDTGLVCTDSIVVKKYIFAVANNTVSTDTQYDTIIQVAGGNRPLVKEANIDRFSSTEYGSSTWTVYKNNVLDGTFTTSVCLWGSANTGADLPSSTTTVLSNVSRAYPYQGRVGVVGICDATPDASALASLLAVSKSFFKF